MSLIITLIASIPTLFIGLFVFYKNRKSATNLLFAIFCCAIFCWTISNYFSLWVLDKSVILFWIRLVMAIVIIQCISLLLFIYTFPKRKIDINKKYLIGVLFLGMVAIIISFTPYLFSDVLLEDGERAPIVQLGIIPYLIVTIGSLILGFIFLIKKMKKELGIIKVQLKYIFIGTLLMFLLSIIFNFIIVITLKISTFVYWSPLFVLPFIILTGYVITRYRFMDIKIVFKKSVIVGTLMTTMTIFIMLVGLLASQIFSLGFNFSTFLTLLLTIGIILLSYRPSRELLNKIFLKQYYDLSNKIKELSSDFKAVTTLDKLSEKIAKKMCELFEVNNIWILVYDRNKKEFVSNFPNKGEIVLSSEDDIYKLLGKKTGPIVKDELNYITQEKLEQKENFKEIVNKMRRLGWDAVFPLVLGEDIYGAIALGKIKNEDVLSEENINTINEFSEQVAITIANVRLYEDAMERVRKENEGK